MSGTISVLIEVINKISIQPLISMIGKISTEGSHGLWRHDDTRFINITDLTVYSKNNGNAASQMANTNFPNFLGSETRIPCIFPCTSCSSRPVIRLMRPKTEQQLIIN